MALSNTNSVLLPLCGAEKEYRLSLPSTSRKNVEEGSLLRSIA